LVVGSRGALARAVTMNHSVTNNKTNPVGQAFRLAVKAERKKTNPVGAEEK